jgi:hypothetical protein
MKIILTEGQNIDIIVLDGEAYLNTNLPTSEEFVAMPENEKVYPEIDECVMEEEETVELDETFYLIDTVSGEHCPKFVGGRPRSAVRRK